MPKKDQQKLEAYVSDFMDEDVENVKPSTRESKAKRSKSAKKRLSTVEVKKVDSEDDDDEDEDQDGRPISSMLQECSSALNSKRKKIEVFAKQCAASHEKVQGVLQIQKSDRDKLNEEFKKQINTVINQWEADIERAKESEEKLNGLLTQQMKLLQQIRIVQTQRFKSIKQLHEQFSKRAFALSSSIVDVENSHAAQHKNVTDDMHKEMTNLQKKFLNESRKQENVNIKKFLHSMLYQ